MRTGTPSNRLASVSPAQQLAGFLSKYTPSMAREGRSALARMRRMVPGACQLIYDNWNGLVVGFGPNDRPSDAVVSILLAKDHVSLCFIDDGPSLPDPEKLLQGSGRVVRHIKLRAAKDLDRSAVQALVAHAVARADPPFDPRARSRLIVRSVSPRQRPRRR